jgi:hypothetical protein
VKVKEIEVPKRYVDELNLRILSLAGTAALKDAIRDNLVLSESRMFIRRSVNGYAIGLHQGTQEEYNRWIRS